MHVVGSPNLVDATMASNVHAQHIALLPGQAGHGIAQGLLKRLPEARLEQQRFWVASRGCQAIREFDVVACEAISRPLSIQRHASCGDAYPGLERATPRVQSDLGFCAEQQAIPNLLQRVLHEVETAIDARNRSLGHARALAFEQPQCFRLRFGTGTTQIQVGSFAGSVELRRWQYPAAVAKEHIEAQLHHRPLALAFEKHLSYSVFAAHRSSIPCYSKIAEAGDFKSRPDNRTDALTDLPLSKTPSVPKSFPPISELCH